MENREKFWFHFDFLENFFLFESQRNSTISKSTKYSPQHKGKEEGGCLYLINWITSLACTDDEEIDTDTDIDENGDEVEDQGKLVTSFKIADISQN